MADEDQFQNAVKGLIDSPGGVLVSDISLYLKSRTKLLVALFIIAVAAGFSLTKSVIKWLIAPERLPLDVNIIVTSPIEFILLQFQISVSFGIVIIGLFLMIEALRKGVNNDAIRLRLAELELKPPKFSLAFITTIGFTILFALAGLLYSWEFLTPMILQYLTEDAQTAGLSTEWRLSGYVGFIVNLALACVIGFQSPVITLLVLRLGVVTRSQISQFRKHIWFTAFVLGAFLSPPDPLSLFLVAMPVVILFEFAMLIESIFKISKT
ncbi:MAG: twin-arginine translocase subunit TatC [Candidatus Poseidoniaceae archaeon]|nr:twin-arginine translocase subunit TatC [Candidatus Poseidoniaceae archaeon]